MGGSHRLPSAQKSLMLDLNTADDYFKAKKQVERLEVADLSQKDRGALVKSGMSLFRQR